MRFGPHRRETLDFPDPALQQLYEQASRAQWRVAELDWAALALERIAPPTRVPLSVLYTDVAFVEAVAARALQQITEQLPAGFSRSFTLMQLADEQEHVRLFSLLAEQLGAPETVSPFLMQLSDELQTVSEPGELLLHLHVMGRALQAVFLANNERALAVLSGAPRPASQLQPAWEAVTSLLRCIVERVGSNEARHVAFGAKYLQHRFAALSPAERRTLAHRASISMGLLYRTFELRSEAFQRLVLHPHALLQQAFRTVQRELSLLGFELDVPPARSR